MPGEEHHGELEPLGRVQRHHLHAVLPGIRLALAGFERRVREEGLRAAAARLASGEKPRAALTSSIEVLDARLAALGLLLLVVLDEPARLST